MVRKQLLLLLVLVIATCVTLPAQMPGFHMSAPGNELYGGYSFSFRDYEHNQDNPVTGGMNGWQASFKTPILPWIGIKADGSGYYKTDGAGLKPQMYFVMVGPEVSQHIGSFTVFVHGLIGTSHLSGTFPLTSDCNFVAAVGGGLDKSLSRNLAWRVTGDFIHTNLTPGSVEVNQLHDLVSSNGRVSTGLVLRF